MPDGTLAIYVDGSGGPGSGYGYLVPHTGESHYSKHEGLTNNQAEYMAIISALKKYACSDTPITIYSDSRLVVSQINHDFAINSDALRAMARQVWGLMGGCSSVSIRWVSRRHNPAGKMLGS